VRREALPYLKAPDVTAYNSLQAGEVRACGGKVFDERQLALPRSFGGAKGNLRKRTAAD